MLCGLAALDITPKLGENIPGYFEARRASGVREPLAVRALACSNTSGAAFALVNLDTIDCDPRLSARARARFERLTGVPGAQMMVSTTHTHTGGPVDAFVPGTLNLEYVEWIADRAADAAALAWNRRRMNAFREAAQPHREIPFALRMEALELVRAVAPLPFVPQNAAEREQRCEEILRIQAGGLARRMAHAHAKCAVIGVSGGLDSTLALIVAARAARLAGLGEGGVVAVTMPCFGTTERTHANALKLAEGLGAQLIEVNIAESTLTHLRDIGHSPDDHDVTYENAQARERTQVLMDIANQRGGLVVGTGDLSELALGWATYNGDHMSMYGVNASIPKTLIRHLVRYVADTAEHPLLREALLDVLDTPVSPELLPPVDGVIAQRTEDIVGPYELHDFMLYHIVRRGESPQKALRLAKIAFAGQYDDETILKWEKTFLRRFFQQQFKRSCLPDGPKVGSVSLSPRADWRMPSDAFSALWDADLENCPQ